MHDLRWLSFVNHVGIWSHFSDSMLRGHSEEECSAMWIGFHAVSDLLTQNALFWVIPVLSSFYSIKDSEHSLKNENPYNIISFDPYIERQTAKCIHYLGVNSMQIELIGTFWWLTRKEFCGLLSFSVGVGIAGKSKWTFVNLNLKGNLFIYTS